MISGCCFTKRRKCWIRSEIRLIPQERGIGAQDPADGGGQLLEQVFELLAGLSGILVGNDGRGRLGSLTFDDRPLLASAGCGRNRERKREDGYRARPRKIGGYH